MKKLYCLLIVYFLVVFPVMAAPAKVDGALGTVESSSTLLEFNTRQIETLKVLGNDYVPATSLANFGCSITYFQEDNHIEILPPTSASLPEPSPSLDLKGKSFKLFDGIIRIGNFNTHGVISEGKVLIPIGALREFYNISITNNVYTLTEKSYLPLYATQTSIENKTLLPTSTTVTDIYFDKDFIYKSTTYNLLPSEVLLRTTSAPSASSIYITSIVTSAKNDTLNYINTNRFGQTQSALFARYLRLQSYASPSDIGDPIDFATVVWAEDTVNSMDLHSDTKYLVWTNIDRQRTYIFEGSTGNWRLIKHFICSTGKSSSPTPKGTFKLTQKVPYFGVEKGYRCKNAFGFINTTYLYHSIMFDKTGSYLLEGKGVLGTKASAGCIRFSVEHSEWFYNNMLSGTKVWIN